MAEHDPGRAALEEAAALAEANRLSAGLPRPGTPAREIPLGASAAAPGEALVTMFFPKPLRLNLSYAEGARGVRFEAGVQKVPARLADHWWLAANGVTRVS
jgi:hypothetical protein